MSGLIVDLFAGGGGASVGIEAALGRNVDIAVNHDPIAIAVHKANHPATDHLEANVWEVRPKDATGGRAVDLLWASPDCRHFSRAKGDVPKSPGVRSLAWVVVRWAKAVRPRIIALENVAEFKTWGPLAANGKPDKARQGETFDEWTAALERLGYKVESRILDASLYGAPTRRKRLFIIARRDGEAIRWPEPTHGPGRLPVRTAAECIDWSIPCRSIFGRKKELAPATLRRVAEGIRRFVLNAAEPFIVVCNHGRDPWRGQSIDDPMATITGAHDARGLVVPTLATLRGTSEAHVRASGHAVEEPLGVQSAQGNHHALVAPLLARVAHGEEGATGKRWGAGVHEAGQPLGTVTGSNDFAVVAPLLAKFRHDSPGAPIDGPMPTVTAGNGRKGRPAGAGHALGIVTPIIVPNNTNNVPRPASEPVPTITGGGRNILAVPTLIQTGRGERPGQTPRVPGLDKPLGAVEAGGSKRALVSAYLAHHFGGEVGRPAEVPLGTVTGRDHHSLVAAHIQKFYGTARAGQDPSEPLHTATAKARFALVTAFLEKHGIPGPHIVRVQGEEYAIADIGLRMLEPHELLAAQFGEYAAAYDLSAAKTKAAKIRLIGNSVCPAVARAIIEANVGKCATVERQEVLWA